MNLIRHHLAIVTWFCLLISSAICMADERCATGYARMAWPSDWPIKKVSFGQQNVEICQSASEPSQKWLRVIYPQGSRNNKAEEHPTGGAQWLSRVDIPPGTSLHFRYYVRFPIGFNFVKGGKLPGLYGGIAYTGGKIPKGDGFTTRYMWRSQGAGEVYAYLPTSEKHGTSIDRGFWHFQPGKWQMLEQQVKLNSIGQKDGSIRVWVDGRLVINRSGLQFRNDPYVKVDGVIFSTFFGGNDDSYMTPVTTYVDFAKFAVSRTYIGPDQNPPR